MCDSPHYVHSVVLRKNVPVPCGKCPPCQKRRVDSWVFRLLEEDKISSSSHFVTLTYDTRHVPISANGFMTLQKADFQKFMKRLRKLTSNKIRYYAAGEYGETNNRPHYHAIIFNVPDAALYHSAWSLEGQPLGIVDVGNVSGDSIAYCTKYINKRKTIPKHSRDDRIKEFSLMSKGLGANYITPKTIKYHTSDLTRNFLTKKGGFRIALPKYYRDKIFTQQQKDQQIRVIKAAVDKIEIKFQIETFQKDLDPDQVKEQHILTRYKQFHQRIKDKKRKL